MQLFSEDAVVFQKKFWPWKTPPKSCSYSAPNFFFSTGLAAQTAPKQKTCKVWTFWEGHKIWKNLPLKFDATE